MLVRGLPQQRLHTTLQERGPVSEQDHDLHRRLADEFATDLAPSAGELVYACRGFACLENGACRVRMVLGRPRSVPRVAQHGRNVCLPATVRAGEP